MTSYLTHMARYNQWVNRRLYDKLQLLAAVETVPQKPALIPKPLL